MTYSLEIKMMIEGFGVTRFNEYRGSREELDDFIHKWVFKLRMESGFRDIEILSVIANGDEDLTHLFKSN